tara:strand:- start:206 stop:553 length:348 start_codon:yes stop_codon:yes gene_type:complete
MKIKIVALKRNEEFKKLLTGRKLSNRYFVMFYKKLLKKESDYLNLSIVAKKKIFSKAVDRNFCKRRLKNVVNQAIKKISLNLNYSYLILAKENVLKKKYFEDLKKTMFEEFNKIR